jgi:meso-butanediol dehydrogenase/(S,S)-butanediol dehydrogenase/diacetyl reductase
MISDSLRGRVALITGTGGGMGRVAAQRFAEEGAIVVGCDLDAERHAETVALVEQAGGQMTGGAPVDLGDPDQARAWVDEAFAAHGRIDIVFNNASAARFGGIEEIPLEDWHFTIRNELDLVFYVTKFAWPHLRVNGGVVINTGSIAGLKGTRVLGQTPHSATKGAVIALTRQLAVEGSEHGIRAVSISPGAIETPPTAELFADETARGMLLGAQLVKRVGQPQDIVEMAVFVASDAAGFMTGVNLVVDGGATAV